MSPLFIKIYRQSLKCGRCSGHAAADRKFCEEHLAQARVAWRQWSEKRKAAGKCAYCDRKSFNGWLRCRLHTMQNREKCKAWVRENKEWKAQYSKERVAALLAKGICRCNKRPISPGFKKCLDCRIKHRK